MTTRHLSDFNELAKQCAEAYADGDDHRGERLLGQLMAEYLRDDMATWLPRVVWDRSIYDEVYSHLLYRFVQSFRGGIPIYRGYLRSQYRWAVWDITRKRAKHREHYTSVEDVEVVTGVLEDLDEGPADFAAASVRQRETRRAFDALERHFADDLRKPRWVTILQFHRRGEESDTVIAEAMGVRRSVVGQQKKAMYDYLAVGGRRYLEHLRDAGEAE